MIKKDICETEVRATGFKKFQEDIMLTSKKIEEYNDELKRLNHAKNKLIAAGEKETKAYREITKEITAVRKSLNQSKDALEAQEKQLPLTALSYNQLKKRAGETTKELYNLSEAADPAAFTKARGELKQYQDQMTKMQQGIKMTNASFKNQKPTVWTNLKQLIPIASITAIGAELTSVANQAIQTFTRLDDKMADVQKTTQMSKAEVKALDAELMKIDTRTSREDLLDLARVAGKLGVAKNEVAGFVRAADQIRVALTEDLGGNVEESIRKIGKLADIFKIKDQLGLEKSLLSIGSAINSLGADSTANEENIVDFTNRTAGIAPQAKVSIQNVMGLGAAIDILGQSAEVGGTTYSQVMTGMFKKTDEYAKVAGMSVKEFTELLNRDANEAFIKFLEGANSGGDMSGMTKKLAGLKLEGSRATQVLGALAGNVDLLRNQQALSNAEFAKATSLQEEANTKNASAPALIEKRLKVINQIVASLGEELMPLWSETLGLTAGFMSILKAVIGTLIKYKGVILAVATVASAYIAVKKLQIFYSKAHLVQIAAEAKGIIASNGATIAATLGAKALAAAKMLVTFQFRAAAIAAKSFFRAIGPIGWAVTAITALVGILKLAKPAVQEVSDASSQLALELSKEKATYDDLKHAVLANAKGSKTRAEAISQINSRYKEYLPNLLTEKMSNEEIASALDLVNKKMEENIKVRIRAQETERINKEQFDAEKEALNKLIEAYQSMGDKSTEQIALAQQQFGELILQLEKTGNKSEFVVGAAKVFGLTVAEMTAVLTTTANTAYGTFSNSVNKYDTLVTAVEKAFKKVTDATTATKLALSGLNALTEKKTIEIKDMGLDQLNSKLRNINGILKTNVMLTDFGRDALKEERAEIEKYIEIREKEAEDAKKKGNDDDGGEKGKWSLASDESYLKAKAELRERQMKGDIASEEEYSRQLLVLEIATLQKRLEQVNESDQEHSKLKSELAEKEYQQTKNDQARTERLLAVTRTPYESEMADYEKRLKEFGLFGVDREQMTEDQQRALLKLEKEHQDKLYNLWLNGLSKQESHRKEKNDAELRKLRTRQNNEIADAITLEQKKALLREWFSDTDLQRVTTKEQAQKIITAKHQEEEQQMLKKHLEETIATYNLLLSGAINPLFALGLTPEMRAKMEEELKKLEESLSKVKREMSEGDKGDDKDTSKSKSGIDILGFSEDQWENFFKKSESVSDSIDKWNMALQAVGNTFGMISDMMSAAENREFKKYEQTANRKKKVLERQLKSGTISQERYNEAVQRIDDETDAKREEMERKQAKRQKVMSLFQALTNTAVAITAALPNIPLVAVVAAMGAIQAATILATPLPGAEEGGLIGVEREQDGKRFNAEFAPRKRGYIRRPTVIRTDGGQPVITGEAGVEYVVPNHLLQVPQIASMVGLIEAARLSGTFRPVNLSAAQAASGTIHGRADGGYVGDNPLGAAMTAGGQVPASTGFDDGVFRELKEVVGKLNKKLDEPIPTYVTINGPNGIETIKNKLKQQQRRAGIGGK